MLSPIGNLHTVDDFLTSEAFTTWLRERRPADQARWQAWLAAHPDRQEAYEQAVATWLVIQGQVPALSDQAVGERVDQVMQRLPDHRRRLGRSWATWAAAACVAGIVIGAMADLSPGTLLTSLRSQASRFSARTSMQPIAWRVVKNTTGKTLVVYLPDKSSVLLSSGSELRFRKDVVPGRREVYLQGEGFFEVAKNPRQPFYVYTSQLTTRVLGTSFQLRAFADEATAQVKVKTGLVTVAPTATPQQRVLLKANQEADVKQAKLVKLEQFSAQHSAPILHQRFVFEHTPLPAILDLLADTYNMPIQYDRHALASCTFTGHLEDVPLLEKIRLVCLATESAFEYSDRQISIQSHGCN